MNPRGLRSTAEGRVIQLDRLLREAVELCWDHEAKRTEPRRPGQITDYERSIIDLLSVSAFDNSFEDAFGALQDKREEMEHAAAEAVERAEKSHNRAAEELTEARKTLERTQCNSTE